MIDPTIVLSVFLGVVGLFSAWIAGARLLKNSPAGLTVVNYRGRSVPAIGGIVLIAALGIAFACMVLAGPLPPKAFSPDLRRSLSAWPEVTLVVFLTAAGFFALGLIDDLSGGGGAKGLRGHLKALARRQVTGGIVKLAGGLALAFAASAGLESDLLPAIVDAVVVAGTANLFNLLDVRPGRACKFFLLGWTPLAVVSIMATGASAGAGRAGSGYLVSSSAIVGAVMAWLPGDLGESAILGDSGSNTIGAILGMGLVLLLSLPARLGAVAVILTLSLFSEVYSFSAGIQRIGPLRWLDGLGRVDRPPSRV
ncbi:MAG: hypothetical protein ACR2FO_09110 [Actinomycetota bacterium]